MCVRVRPLLRILMPAWARWVGTTSSATSDVERVFKVLVLVVASNGEMGSGGDDSAEVALVGSAGVGTSGMSSCGEEESTVTVTAGAGGARDGCRSPPQRVVVASIEEGA